MWKYKIQVPAGQHYEKSVPSKKGEYKVDSFVSVSLGIIPFIFISATPLFLI